MIGKKLSLFDFIKKAKLIHGDKYDYSESNYINYHTAVKIICKKHGEFWQKPVHHISNKNGCPKCKSNYKLNNITFIEKAKQVHGDKYDYSLVNYIKSTIKIKIICKLCKHIFEQLPSAHLNKQGCPNCYGNKLKKLDQFIYEAKRVHGDKYNYSLVDYKNCEIKVKIICPVHGVFEQRPISHLKFGCFKCSVIKRGLNHRLKVDVFIDRAKLVHGDKYDYSLVKNIESVQKNIKIICKEHNIIFEQRPDNHLSGKVGCLKCLIISKPEKELLDFIKENYNKEIITNSKRIISPYELDIYLPDLKLAFEYNGLYWHSELNKPKDYHLIKTELCEKQGIHLIHIYEDDWLYKQDIVKSMILNLLYELYIS